MDPSTNGHQEEHRFPLMRLSGELRNVIYRHALAHSLPNLILPRWMQVMQRWHEYTIGHPVATGPIAASSFINLQLSNRQVYDEASYNLYQSCQFSFNIAPSNFSFLDGCLSKELPTWNLQDKSYIHRIENIILTANWDGLDWAEIRRFSWTNWEDITAMVCDELLGFSGLRKLTLDWRVPNPCDVLQPTKNQWLSIFPSFELLQARRPEIRVEVLAWQQIPGSVPFKHQEIRRSFKSYTQEETTKRPRNAPVSVPTERYSSYQWPPLVLFHPRYSSYPWPQLVLPDPRSLNYPGPSFVLTDPRYSSHQSRPISTRLSRNPWWSEARPQ